MAGARRNGRVDRTATLQWCGSCAFGRVCAGPPSRRRRRRVCHVARHRDHRFVARDTVGLRQKSIASIGRILAQWVIRHTYNCQRRRFPWRRLYFSRRRASIARGMEHIGASVLVIQTKACR